MSEVDVKEKVEKDEKDKTVTIIVAGTPHEWTKNSEICHIDVVKLEFSNYDPQTTYSVKYKNGNGNKPEGILPPGSCVKVKEGMVFSVSETGQS